MSKVPVQCSLGMCFSDTKTSKCVAKDTLFSSTISRAAGRGRTKFGVEASAFNVDLEQNAQYAAYQSLVFLHKRNWVGNGHFST